MHCHNAPSIFPRRQTDWEFIADLKIAGMSGAVLKSHESSTVDRAALLRAKEPGLQIYGGLVCNYFTGGLSPYTVDAAIRLGAKCIWMPTISASAHQRHFAQQKTKLFASSKPLLQPTNGLQIWDSQQQILPAVIDILQLIAEADIVLATGHLSPAEVLALVKKAKQLGVHKVLIQHADMGIAPVPFDMQQELVNLGAIIEKCYLACSDEFDFTLQAMAASIQQLGTRHCVMVTDYGQRHNLPIVEAFSAFVDEMSGYGVSDNDICDMIAINPRKLLGV